MPSKIFQTFCADFNYFGGAIASSIKVSVQSPFIQQSYRRNKKVLETLTKDEGSVKIAVMLKSCRTDIFLALNMTRVSWET